MSYCKIVFIFLVVLLLSNPVVNAASAPRPIVSHNEWIKYARAYDYSEHYKSSKQSKTSFSNKQSSKPSFLTGFPFVVYILIGLLIITIVGLIVLLILGIMKRSNETISKPTFYTSTAYQDIENADLENDLQEVLMHGLYKEALRLRYLIVLRTLNKHKLVIWKIDKTNGNYLQEMQGKIGFEIFRRLTNAFERAWYGDMQITEREYLNLIPVFDQINLITDK